MLSMVMLFDTEALPGRTCSFPGSFGIRNFRNKKKYSILLLTKTLGALFKEYPSSLIMYMSVFCIIRMNFFIE